MNVWAINKDLSIKHFLIELIHRFGENTFCLNENIQHTQAAEIFMADRPTLKAYIYSFSQGHDRYGIDLYFPIVAHEIVGENEELMLEELLSIIQTHFDLV